MSIEYLFDIWILWLAKKNRPLQAYFPFKSKCYQALSTCTSVFAAQPGPPVCAVPSP